MAEMKHVEQIDITKLNSAIIPEGGSAEQAKDGICHWNGYPYVEGQEICSNGTKLRCFNGSWNFVGPCS